MSHPAADRILKESQAEAGSDSHGCARLQVL